MPHARRRPPAGLDVAGRGTSGPVFYGWVIVGVATFAMFASTLTGGAGFSVFIGPMSHELGWSRSVLAGALSAGTVVGAIAAPLVGRLIDRYGARLILTLCGLGIAVTLGVVSGVRSELVFLLAYGAARTIDMGALNLAVTTAVSNWFVRYRGRALGIAVTGNALGVMLMVPVIQWLIDGPGWRVAWVVVGVGSGLVLAILAALLLRRRPEDLGLVPDGRRSDAGRPVVRAVEVREADWSARLAARSRAFWLLVLASCGSQLAVSAITTHQAALLVDHGLSPAAAAGAVSLYGFTWTVGTLLWGVAIERLPSRLALAVASLVVAGCCIAVLQIRDVTALIVFACVYGLANGGREAVDAVAWADYFGRHAAGAIRGLSRPFVVGSGAIGSFGAGVGYDLTGSYSAVMVGFAGIALLGAVASLLARPPRASAARPPRRSEPPA